MKQFSLVWVFSFLCMLSIAQENVFHREYANTNDWWDNANPWFYQTSSNNQDRPDNSNSGTTRHNVFIGHNNNTAMNINGAFFTLRSLNFQTTAMAARTFGGNNTNEGIAFTSGIFNNSAATHTFNARIAADANIILNAADGPLVFNREIFTNGNTVTLRGPRNIDITDVVSQAGNIVKELADTATLSGPCTYTGTTTINGGVLRLNRAGGSTIPAANDLTINSGGTLQVSTNQSVDILVVNSGGALQVDAGATLTVTGAFTGGGTIINNGRIVLAGSATQSFPGVGAAITAMNELEINNASNVNMNNSLTITGSLILTSGTLNIQANNLLDLNGASLVRTSGFLDGSSTSDFTVRGTTGGTVNIPLNNTNISLRNVTIAGARTVAMNGVNHMALSGAFTVAASAAFDNGGESQITQNGGGTVSITGKFITRDVQGFTGSGAAIPGITPTLNTGCTIEYGLAGNQAVNTRTDYSNITFSGSGNKTLSGAFNPNGLVYITGNAVVQQGSNSFGDGTTSLTMDGGRLVMTGARTSPDMTGAYNLTEGVVEFAGPSNQTIRGTASYPYQNIEISGADVGNSSGNINLNNGGTFTVKTNGVFTINANAIIGPTGLQTVTIENGGKFVCGDVDGFSGSANTSVRNDIETINLNPGSTVEYSRTSAQVFSSRTDYKNVTISGGGNKTLNGASTISGVLTLTSGLLTTTSANLLTMSNGSSAAGASTSSFVNGPLQKIGNSDFTFPVGKIVGGTNHYRTIAISNLSGTESFTAEFFRSNARLLGPVLLPLQRVSQCEYWTLNRQGSVNANVTLSWTSQSPCNVAYVNDLLTLVVARFNGTNWVSEGQSSNSGVITPGSGTVTSNLVTSFSPFSLGSTDVNLNPLPFNLTRFNANLRANAIVLDWSVSNNNEQEEYIIERSRDGIVFQPLAAIAARLNVIAADYTHIDQQPLNGWNYYRLRAKDYQNKIQISHIVRVFWSKGKLITVLPNPASEKIVINLSDPSSIRQMQIVNATGQVLYQINSIRFLNEVNISSLQAGMYYIRFLGQNGLTTWSFVKQ
ncbi:MAG: T9SS type A sorting domain-containing protein [Chitinophagaceae bacterium]|nr:T9SS type A sorting domain-containing protein [Chitinophagaceae bacterium]